MGLLDDLAGDVHSALADEVRDGTLRRFVPGEGTDPHGDPLPGHHVSFPFKGWRDSFDAQWLQAGIPSTDARIVILAGSVETDPRQEDQVEIEDRWWQVTAVVEIDPAGATYSLQAFEIEDPTE